MPAPEAATAATAETVELLQQLIRNACVNDGTPESGHEVRSAEVLTTYLEGAGLDVEVFEPTPGRRSIVARIEGTDSQAPTLCLMGHTDVVPVSPGGWRHDPFGGELIDGEVWGRGAVDMLNLTASMAVAMKHLARTGWRPKGTLVYLGVADEEAGGTHGAEWLVDHDWDAVACDYVVTESGGWGTDRADGHRSIVVTVGEKGVAWRRVTVKGTPGHGSMPYGADNALVTAAEVVRRLATYRPAAVVDEIYRSYLASLDLPADLQAALGDPGRLDDALARIPDPRVAKFAHACTHTTFSPNMVHGGVKTNVIPDEVVLEVDIRSLPGQTSDDIDRMLADALGPLAGGVDVEIIHERPATQSPLDTPLADALTRAARRAYPEATLVPRVTAGGTDATFFRDRGSVAYGFGLLSRDVTFADFASRFHGHDERIDVESLRLTTACWLDLCRDVLG